MRKTLLLISLLVVLAAPAMASPRSDGPGDRRGGFIARIVRLIRALDDIVAGPPHP